MYRGSNALRSSIVSYWPGQVFSFSRDPSMHLSSTSPTRNIIFTPIKRAQMKITVKKTTYSRVCGSYRRTGAYPTLSAQRTTVKFWKRRTWTTLSCRGWALSCACQGAGTPRGTRASVVHSGSLHPTVLPPNYKQNKMLLRHKNWLLCTWRNSVVFSALYNLLWGGWFDLHSLLPFRKRNTGTLTCT